MIKQSAYEKARDKAVADAVSKAAAESATEKPCMVCGMSTALGTLRDYGSRCFPCYQSENRTPRGRDNRMAALEREAGTGPQAWARLVVLRAERGVNPPTRLALEMAREVVHGRYVPLEHEA